MRLYAVRVGDSRGAPPSCDAAACDRGARAVTVQSHAMRLLHPDDELGALLFTSLPSTVRRVRSVVRSFVLPFVRSFFLSSFLVEPRPARTVFGRRFTSTLRGLAAHSLSGRWPRVSRGRSLNFPVGSWVQFRSWGGCSAVPLTGRARDRCVVAGDAYILPFPSLPFHSIPFHSIPFHPHPARSCTRSTRGRL